MKILFGALAIAVMILGGLYSLVYFQPPQYPAFDKFLKERNCAVVTDFGKAVVIEVPTPAEGSVFTPRISKAYHCKDFPFLVLD